MSCFSCGSKTVMAYHGRQGGRRQRHDREAELEHAAGGNRRSRSRSPRPATLPSPAASSSLAEKLLFKWAWRQMSAVEVQEIASAAENDYGENNETVHKLSRLGSSGRNPQNAQRDLVHRFMKKPCKRLLQYLPGEDPEVDTVLYPHEVFSTVHKDYPAAFARRFGADRGRLAEFWEAFRATRLGGELVARHPGLRGAP